MCRKVTINVEDVCEIKLKLPQVDYSWKLCFDISETKSKTHPLSGGQPIDLEPDEPIGS